MVDLLQEFIINYKTNLIRHNLGFVEARYNEMKKEFEGAQRRLFSFQDAHRNMVAERIGPDYQVLLDEYDISRGIYQNLAQQLEQTRLAVKKETPVFSIIEPVRVPVEKSTPRRALILMVSMVLGGVFGFVVLYGFIVFLDVRASWKEG